MASIGKCTKEGCNVEQSGQCLDGIGELEKCPNYTLVNAAEEEPSAKTSIDLHNGNDISYDTANKIAGASRTRLIVLAGAVDSGKTTLLASMYEKFLENSFATYLFAGSQTLMGFEKRCHLSRIASNRAIPETERTKPGFEQALLHLRIRKEDLNVAAQDILLSDISGETYRMARDYSDECRKLSVLKRADHVALFIDGDKIVKLDRRHEAFKDADLLLRRCIESNMLNEKSFVEVLFSKYDVIHASEDRTDTLHFVEKIKTSLTERYAAKLGSLKYYLIASRPLKHNGDILPFAYGLEDVFKAWIETTPFELRKPSQRADSINVDREFSRYLIKMKVDL